MMNTNAQRARQRAEISYRRFLAGILTLAASCGSVAHSAPDAPPAGKPRPTRPVNPAGKRPGQKVILPPAQAEPATDQPANLAPAEATVDPSAAGQPGTPPTDPNAVPAMQPGQTPYPQPGVDIPAGSQVPPDVQKQIDQMMQVQTPPGGTEGQGKPSAPMTPAQRQEERRKKAQADRERAAQGQNPGQVPPGGTPGGVVPGMGGAPGMPGMIGGDSTKIDIPAGDQSVPPEQRRYKFSIKDASFPVLLDGVARETGLAVQGDIPPDGVVSFVTDQEVSFDEMLARVRMLLFQYKPLEPYWLARERTHLQVVKVNDFIRRFPPDRVYRTVRDFRAANLSADELVLVLFEPECGAIGAYAPVRDWLPDYVRVTPLEQKNAMAIYALAGDVEKFLWWGEQIVACNDPRKLEIVEIKFITPTEASEKLQILMQLDPAKMAAGAGRVAAPRGVPGQIGGTGLEGVAAPEVSIVPEDAQGVLIVRAMPDKIEEMKKLLPYIDVNTVAHYLPVVVDVKFADPESLIATVQQVLSSSTGETAAPGGMPQPGAPKPRRSARKSQANPAAPAAAPTVSAADVSMIPHPTISAIIVMGTDPAVAKVKDLIAQLDVETQIGPERIPLQYIDADTAVQTITPILSGTAPGQPANPTGVPRKGAQVPPQLIADPGGASIWFTGTSKDLGRVRTLLKDIDVATDAVALHIVKLVHQKPSFVATILAQVSDTGATPAAPGAAPAPKAPPRGKRTRGAAAPTAPGAGQATSSTTSGAKITADDDQGRLYIFCTDVEWEQYKTIIAELEGEVQVPEYTLIPVKNITPDLALEKLSALVPDICGPGGVAAPGAANAAPGPGVRCEATDDGLLILGANQMQIDTVRRLLPEFDRPLNIEQRTFEIKHADAGEIKQALEALINGNTPGTAIAPAGGRRNRANNPAPAVPAGATAATTGVSPGGMTIVQVDRRLIVSAAPPILQRVADYITQFDVKADRRQIKVYQDFRPGTDIDAIAHNLATIIGGTTTTQAGSRIPRPAPGGAAAATPTGPEPGPQFIPLTEGNKLIVIAEETLFVEIEEMLKVLRETADPETIVRKYVPVKYADPNEIVEKIEPLLDMMVKRLIAQGEVVESVDETGTAQIKQRAGIPVGGALAQKRPYHLAPDGRNKRIVIAATQKIVDLATELVADFDTNQDKEEPVVALIEVKHVDPVDLVDQIDPLLAIKVQRIGGEADLVDPTEGATAGQPGMPRGAAGLPGQRGANQAKAQRYYIAPDERNKRIVVAAVQKIVDEAKKLVVEFDVPGGEKGIEVESLAVKFVDPVILVDMIDPVLTMKVEQFLGQGELAPDAAAMAGQTPQAAQAARNQLQRQLGRNVGGRRFHMEPDQRNKQIVIAAPRLVIDEAKRLVTLFDVESAVDKAVFETMTLSNADPAEMVKAVKELMGSPVRATPARAKAAPAGAAAQPAPTIEETIAGMFNIVVAPSGRAVVLSGPAKDVERAKGWVAQLDTISSGKTIKIYELKFADPEVVVDLIMNTVDTPDKLAAGRQPMLPAKPKGEKDEEEEDEDDWEIETTITRTGTDLYVRADLVNQTIVVATTPTKLAEIDRLITQLDAGEEVAMSSKKVEVPKRLFDLKNADDEYDAKTAFNTYVEAIWQPERTLPKARVGPGKNIIVECVDDSRWDEIAQIVAKYADVPKKEDTKRKVIQAPSGMSASQVAGWIELAYPGIEFHKAGTLAEKQKDYGLEVVKAPQPAAQANPCVLPLSLQRSVILVGSVALAQAPEDEPPADEPAPEDAPVEEMMRETVEQAIINEQMIQQQAEHERRMAEIQQAKDNAAQAPAGNAKPTAKVKDDGKKNADETAKLDDEAADYSGKRVNIVYDDNTGRLILEGPESIIKDVPDWIKDLKDELSKGVSPPDIRIVRVKYIDVYTAQDILEEMFNTTRSQMQNIQLQQQQQQMRMQQQIQQQQLRAQQQAARQQQSQGKGGAQKEADQQQQLTGFEAPEVPQSAVRIYPNPRDRTLILRADTIQYPAIFEMLATIDQPRPVDSVHRIIQLKKLNAVDTEALLKDWLGLEEAKGRTQAQRGGGQQQVPGGMGSLPGRAGPGSALPESIVSPTKSGTGFLGVDPQDIKLSSNPENNTILVMAPKEALDYIENLVNDLEAQDIAARQWKSYALVYADPDEVSEYLTARFNEKRATGRDRAKPAPDASVSTTASSLQTATFVSYPRLKMLSVQATDEQLVEIDALIKELDVEAKEDDFRTIALTQADAADVAATLTDMFGTGGSARASTSSRRDGESRTESVTRGGIRFIGDDGGRVVFYTAPAHLDQRIAGVVKELEEAASVNKLRTIQLQHAKASTVAEAIEGAMSGARRSSSRGSSRGAAPAGGGAGGSGGGSSGATPGSFSITASDSTKRLFVVADEGTFNRIDALAKALDLEPKMDVEFKVFPLVHADAESIYDTLSALMTEYVKRLPPNSPIEAFSVEPNAATNSLIVLGGPIVFGFVEDALRRIDTPAAAPKQDIRTIQLLFSDAEEVQAAVQAYLRKPGTGGSAAPGGRGGGAQNAELVGDTRVSILTQTNSIVISGNKEKLDQLETVIRDLDKAGEKGSVPRIIALKFANVGQLLPMLQEMFTTGKTGGSKKGPPPVIGANEVLNALVVRGSPTDVAAIQSVVDSMDNEQAKAAESVKIVQIQPGVNLEELASIVENSVNEGATALAPSGTKNIPRIVVTAEPRSNILVIAGSPMLFSQAEAMARKIEQMGPAGGVTTTVFKPNNVPVDDIQRLIDQLTNPSTGGGSDRSRRPGGGGGGNRPSRGGGGGNRPRESAPAPSPRP